MKVRKGMGSTMTRARSEEGDGVDKEHDDHSATRMSKKRA